ncbi:MAG: hypothetical protein N2C14_10670 [Planctomycetales bacterium]
MKYPGIGGWTVGRNDSIQRSFGVGEAWLTNKRNAAKLRKESARKAALDRQSLRRREIQGGWLLAAVLGRAIVVHLLFPTVLRHGSLERIGQNEARESLNRGRNHAPNRNFSLDGYAAPHKAEKTGVDVCGRARHAMKKQAGSGVGREKFWKMEEASNRGRHKNNRKIIEREHQILACNHPAVSFPIPGWANDVFRADGREAEFTSKEAAA